MGNFFGYFWPRLQFSSLNSWPKGGMILRFQQSSNSVQWFFLKLSSIKPGTTCSSCVFCTAFLQIVSCDVSFCWSVFTWWNILFTTFFVTWRFTGMPWPWPVRWMHVTRELNGQKPWISCGKCLEGPWAKLCLRHKNPSKSQDGVLIFLKIFQRALTFFWVGIVFFFFLGGGGGGGGVLFFVR